MAFLILVSLCNIIKEYLKYFCVKIPGKWSEKHAVLLNMIERPMQFFATFVCCKSKVSHKSSSYGLFYLFNQKHE